MPLFRPYEHRRSGNREGSAALSGSLFTQTDDDALDSEEALAPENALSPDALSPDALPPHALSPDALSPDEPGTRDEVAEPKQGPKKQGPKKQGPKKQEPTKAASGSGKGAADADASADAKGSKTTRTENAPRARLQPKGEKKNRPTRSRAEAERARREQLHPTLTPKEAKARNRELKFQARQDALKKQESTPERELLRDYIDSRWTVAEFILPVFVLLWAASLATVSNVQLQYVLSLVMSFAIVVMFFNIWWLWRGFKREAQARLKNPNFRGLLMYGMNRMMWIRRFRRPPPRIPRGGEY